MSRIEVPVVLRRRETIDLTERYESIPQPQICRTCMHTSNREWPYTPGQRMEMLAAGATEEDLRCAPDKDLMHFKVLEKADWRDRVVSIHYESPERTRAFVDSCGHTIAPKCRGCARFIAETVPVPYSTTGAKVHWMVDNSNGKEEAVPYTDDDSPIRWWNVQVGGHCSIPAEGITVDGKITYCDRQTRGRKIENPSCANCKWLYYTSDYWMADHLEVNRNAALTPWEREHAAAQGESAAQGIGLALWRKQTDPIGRIRWYGAKLLKAGYHNGMFKFRVEFDHNRVVAVLPGDDDRFRVHVDDGILDGISEPVIFDNPPRVAVEIAYPYNKMFRLPMPLRERRLVWPPLPKGRFVERNSKKLVQPNCPRCSDKPCYYHAKKPVRNELTGDITFERPKGDTAFWAVPPEGRLHLVEVNGEVLAFDGNNNLPEAYGDDRANATVFRQWLPTLLDQARQFGPDGPRQVLHQYFEMMNFMAQHGYRKLRPSWLVPSSVEPSKPHCSNPFGMDLRKVFGDSFGLERVEFDFDFGATNTMRVEEELRVGYRQHEHTPQRLQEEILANIRSHEHYDPDLDDIVHPDVPGPPHWHRVKIKAVGNMLCNGAPVTSTAEFYDLLDDEVTVGMHGESERKMSRRQQLFGYQMSRGFYGKRSGGQKTAMPSADSEMAIFDWDDEPDIPDIADAWGCPECQSIYAHSEVEFGDPRCECGSSLVYMQRSRLTNNPRARGGVGSAVIKESEQMLERRRLYTNLCPNWQLRGSRTPIGLADVAGPRAETPVAIESKRHDTVVVHKVAVLTEEHKAINRDYQSRLYAVHEAREDYKSKNPDVSAEDLVKLFPTPEGEIYQEKAAGSLAKMG